MLNYKTISPALLATFIFTFLYGASPAFSKPCTPTIPDDLSVDEKHYLQIRIYESDVERYLIWDIADNKPAQIDNGAGGTIDFPCELSDISAWLTTTTDITAPLITISNTCSGASKITAERCTDFVCTTSRTDEINCHDVSGYGPLSNQATFIRNYNDTEVFPDCTGYPINGCNDQSGISFEQNENIIDMVFPSYELIFNNTQEHTAYQVKLNWTTTTEFTAEKNFCRGCMTHDLWDYSHKETEVYEIYTPLGFLCNWSLNNSTKNYSFQSFAGGTIGAATPVLASKLAAKQDICKIHAILAVFGAH